MADDLYSKVYDFSNLFRAWKKARTGKTLKHYVIEFEANLLENLINLQKELKSETYKPHPLKTFILRDPKTRKISKSAFRDRIVHHTLVRVIEPIFDKTFIYDSCANRTGKGTLFALKRFDLFKRKVTNNLKSEAFCLKADIKHYFDEVNHNILIGLISRKIADEKMIKLVKIILQNHKSKKVSKGMPLGNLTSQFFANVYLNELDYFVKHKLKIKYYIRYVDDFVVLHNSKSRLTGWKNKINKFLKMRLKLELHSQKSKIISLSRGIDFVGFRNFYYFRLLRKRNVQKMCSKIKQYQNGLLNRDVLTESFQGWNAYAKWSNSYELRKNMAGRI